MTISPLGTYDDGSIETPPVVPATGVTWALLNQHHDCYDAERVYKLNLLLHGNAADEPKLFMLKLKSESQSAWEDRLSFATYENNFGEIINDYGSTLFSKPMAVMPAVDAEDETTPGEEPDPNSPHMQFQQHFTLDDRTMADFMHDIQTESNATSCSYFGIDFKEDSTPYAYYIDPISVLDWEKNDEGHFIFLVLRNDECIRTSAKQLRDTITTTFTVWTHKNDKIKVEQYRIEYPKNKEPKGNVIVPKVKAEVVGDLTFKNIPVIDCFTPDNLCIGKIIGQLAGSLFARYSTYLFCLNRGINPLLVYKQGAELPANGDLSILNEDDDRGVDTVKRAPSEGKAVIGPNDELEWKSPDARAYSVVQEQLKDDKNELYRLTASLNSIIGHAGISAAQTRSSGVAKLIDNLNKEHALEAYAKLVKEWVMRAFKIAFDALEDPTDMDAESDVVWQCKGMENYKIVDEENLLAKIEALPTYKANMPSKTSYKQLLMDVAYEVHPSTNVGTMNKILEEIADNVENTDLDEVHQSINPQGTIDAEAAKKLDDAVPQQAGSTPKVNSPGGSDTMPQQREVGKSGNPVMPEGSHMQTGQHIEWQVVFDILKSDYDPKDLEWVKMVSWRGPVEVSIEDISFAGEEDWSANKPGASGQKKVDKYSEIMADKGFSAFQPVILANMPHNDEKFTIIDGRHRVKASEQSGVPLLAYIADVGSMDKDTPHMQLHDKQMGKKS